MRYQDKGYIIVENFLTESEHQHYLEVCKSYTQPSTTFSLSKFVGIAFVSFEFQHYRNYLFDLYLTNPEEFQINGKQLELKWAHRPDSIEWFHLGITKWSKFRRAFVSYSTLTLFVLLTFYGVDTINHIVFEKYQRMAANGTFINHSFW